MVFKGAVAAAAVEEGGTTTTAFVGVHVTLPGTYVVPAGMVSVTWTSIAVAFPLLTQTMRNSRTGIPPMAVNVLKEEGGSKICPFVSLASLLVGSVSNVPAGSVTVTVFVRLKPTGVLETAAVTVYVKKFVEPPGSAGKLMPVTKISATPLDGVPQELPAPVAVQVQLHELISVGRVSDKVAPVTLFGPVFQTLIVYVRVPPAMNEVTPSSLVTCRFTGTSTTKVSVLVLPVPPLVEETLLVVFTFEPPVVAVTSTVTEQVPAAAIVPPEKVRLVLPAEGAKV